MMVNQIRAKNGIPYDSLSYENALISGFAPHRYGTQVLYDELRRYLAKNPL
jgi:hypothetical protein